MVTLTTPELSIKVTTATSGSKKFGCLLVKAKIAYWLVDEESLASYVIEVFESQILTSLLESPNLINPIL